MKLSGVFASLPTPFDYRGEIYRAKIAQNVGRWNRAELAGYLVAGRAGEGSLLTGEEKRLVWEMVAAEAKSGAILLAGAGAASVRETVELTKHAASVGYHAAVIPPPTPVGWGAESPETACLYYRGVADQAGLPVIVENTPAESTGLSGEELAALARHPNIIAVIDESPDGGQAPPAKIPEALDFLAGESSHPASLLISGASGMVSGFAAAAPFFCLNLEEAVRTREHDAARVLDQSARPAIDLLRLHHGIAGLKYALDLNGYYGGPPRLPLPALRTEARREIEAALDGIGS